MKKTLKITLIAVAALILLVLGAQLFISYKVKSIIEDQLTETTRGRYISKVGHVRVNLFTRSVSINGIKIKTDVYSREDSCKYPDLYADIGRITFRGIRYSSRKGNKSVSVTTIRVNSPYISIKENCPPEHMKDDDSDSRRDIRHIVQRLGVSNLYIRNGHLDYTELTGSDTLSYELDNLFVSVKGFVFGDDIPDPKKVFYCDDINITADNFRHKFSEGYLLLEIDAFRMRTSKKSLSVGAVRLLPQHPKYEYAWTSPGHADWTQVKTGKVVITGLDYGTFQTDSILRIDSIYVSEASIASYKNRKINRIEKIKPILYQSLRKIPFGVDIRKVSIRNTSAEYEELSVKGTAPGKIWFTELQGELTDVANFPRPEKPYFRLDAHGKLMGLGLAKVSFNFPVDPSADTFSVHGSLSPMSLTGINPIIQPLANIRINKGSVTGLSFTTTANSHTANTDLTLLYKDLDVLILKNDDGQIKERKILSNLLNGILIREQNPDNKGTRSTSSVTIRDPYRSQFNYLWKMLLPGLKETVGIPDSQAVRETEKDGEIHTEHEPMKHRGIFGRLGRKKNRN